MNVSGSDAVLGISGQDAESKTKFSDKLGGVPFPLLIDEGDSVRKSFGIKKDLLGLLDVSVRQQKQRSGLRRVAISPASLYSRAECNNRS